MLRLGSLLTGPAWISRFGPFWRPRLAAGLGALSVGLVARAFAFGADFITALLKDFQRAPSRAFLPEPAPSPGEAAPVTP